MMHAQVADQHITRLDMIPDIEAESLQVTVQGGPSAIGLPVMFQIGRNSTKVRTALLCMQPPLSGM